MEEVFKYETREGWLRAAVEALREIVSAPAIHVSMGRCKSHGRQKAIGECWDGRLSEDGAAHIFIDPTLTRTDPARVLDVLVHEIIHAKVGLAEGHRGEFARVAREVGLLKPWTATTAGDALKARLQEIADGLGCFPHAALRTDCGQMPKDGDPPKRKTYLRLWECKCDPPVKARVSSDDFKATCGECDEAFECKTVGKQDGPDGEGE